VPVEIKIVSQYRPYDQYPAFAEGRRAYARGNYRNAYNPNGVDAQAWHRGLEAEMQS
jgi:hypothetical protein